MTELKDLMRDMAARARTYDITEKAIKISRRRRTVARTATPAIMAVAVALGALTFRALPTATTPWPSNVTPPVACDVTRLLPPGEWAQSFAKLASPNGRFVGGHVAALDGDQKPVIWDNGVPLRLPMSGYDVFLGRIANNGDAIGNYLEQPNSMARKSFLWRGGKLTVLKGHNTYAGAFNSSGAVVGTVDDRGAVWRDPSKDPEFLEVPDSAATVRAYTIDDTGQILGIVLPQQPIELAVWSPSGELRVFARPAHLDEQWSLTPIEFDNGVVRFWAHKRDGEETMAGRWDARTDTYELTPSDATIPSATDNGWQLKQEGDKYYVAGGGSQVELTKPAGTGGNASNYYLNHDGRTAVTSLHLREQGHVAAVMWRCR